MFDDTEIPDHPYPELREVLEIFVTAIEEALAENLIGVYLVGSLASGDFDLDSDVDFLVVIDTELTEADTQRLQAIQIKVHNIDCYPAKHLEGSFISIEDLNDWSTVEEKPLYYFDNGSTTIERSVHDNNWHVRWILRERGITLLGQDPKTILRPIPPEALSSEMKTKMVQIVKLFEDAINQPLNFLNSQFGQPFIVLTYCRMLHTLHTGTVQSKKAGAEWAKHFVEPTWIKLIDQAWHDREGVRFGVKIGRRADASLLDETLAFTKYAATHADTPMQQTLTSKNDETLLHIIAKGNLVMLRGKLANDSGHFARWQIQGEWRLFDAPWEEGLDEEKPPDTDPAEPGAGQKERDGFNNRAIIATLDNVPLGWVNRYGHKDNPNLWYVGIDICEDAYLNRGCGTEALRLWVDYLFTDEAIHKICLDTWSFNLRMMHVAEKVGFKSEGSQREMRYWQDEWLDLLHYGILRDEWVRPHVTVVETRNDLE